MLIELRAIRVFNWGGKLKLNSTRLATRDSHSVCRIDVTSITTYTIYVYNIMCDINRNIYNILELTSLART